MGGQPAPSRRPDRRSGVHWRPDSQQRPGRWLAVLLLFACIAHTRSQAIQDSRCYLMNGGAVESFFIGEDTPPGATIGTLSVNGDPGPAGDISLSVQERDGGLALVPGSKNVTLTKALDREQRSGPSSLYVNVRCDRRRTTDPSFVIPVSVRVWDVNDNAPQWSGAPYRAALSEAAAVGTVVPAPLKAVDLDQPGPHSDLRYSVLDGPHSEYFTFPNELQPILVVAKPLDYETAPNLTLTLRARDQALTPRHADARLTVTVLDADDQNPKFTHDHYTIVIPNDVKEGAVLEPSPGPITAYDQDRGIRAPVTYSLAGVTDLVTLDRDSGIVRVGRGVVEGGGELPSTVVVKATQVDNPDRYALATLYITRPSAPLLQGVSFTQRAYHAAVREDTPPGTVVTTLYTRPERPKNAAPLQFYVSERSFLESFAIGGGGGVLLRRPLDYETRRDYAYQVMVTDGQTNDTASLNISVLNVNEWEPRFKYPQYEFRVDAAPLGGTDSQGDHGLSQGDRGGPGLLPVGKLDVHDGDTPDTITLSLRGKDANLFYINSAGELFLRSESLSALNSSLLHVLVTATDSGDPPKQSSVPVLVHAAGAITARVSQRGAVAAGAAVGGALLLLVILVLIAALVRRRRRAKASPSASPSSKTSTFASPDKQSPANGHEVAPPAGALGVAPSGSLLSVSAGASTILAANSSSSLDLRGDTLPSNGNRTSASRQSTRYPKSKVAPLPPQSPLHGPPDTLMSDHLRGPGGRSGVAWPSQTIPARVKKLSWDDAADNGENKGSEQPPNSTPAPHDHLNLTVYF